jgi:hypothetical protein
MASPDMSNYERWGSLSDIGDALYNIGTGTSKGFGYDLEDPQDLATSLAMSIILPGFLGKIGKNIKVGAKAKKAVSDANKKIKANINKKTKKQLVEEQYKTQRQVTRPQKIKEGVSKFGRDFAAPYKGIGRPFTLDRGIYPWQIKGATGGQTAKNALRKLVGAGIIAPEVVQDIRSVSRGEGPWQTGSPYEWLKYLPLPASKIPFVRKALPFSKGVIAPGAAASSAGSYRTGAPFADPKPKSVKTKDSSKQKDASLKDAGDVLLRRYNR